MTSNRSVPLALLAAALAAGCATAPRDNGLEPSAAVSTEVLAWDEPVEPARDDPTADWAALDALHALEYRSLAKNGDHLAGVVAVPDARELERALLSEGGGPASTAVPAYDIDVISFAAHDRVKYYVDYFRGPARDRFAIWLSRLPRYEGMIRGQFRANGVPEDLVYLGLIESGYSNTAVSRANAVGMWQFIAATGRRYGLTIDIWVDERRDPFKATEAAARHLADLNAQFGSWYLAAAAYNAGEGRVTRGIRRLRTHADSVSDETFFDLSDRRFLRLETRDYVPKLIAAALIAKDPARHGFDPVTTTPPLEFDEITVPDATGLDVLAGLADTSGRALMELNPQYVRGVTPPARRSVVRVPRGSGAKVMRRYQALPPVERVNFVEHVVSRGETLSEIGRRYGIGVNVLRAANGNVNPRRLRVGMRLVIPVSRAARQQASVGRAPAPSAGVAGVRVHVVRAGDTLWKLSQQYGVSVTSLQAWNGIDPSNVLRVGQEIHVAGPAGSR